MLDRLTTIIMHHQFYEINFISLLLMALNFINPINLIFKVFFIHTYYRP